MRTLPLFFALFCSLSFGEDAVKRSRSGQSYSHHSASGVSQQGEAKADREVKIEEGDEQTEVDEAYQREHRYRMEAPYRAPATGTFRSKQEANRTYYHHGDAATKKKIDDFESSRLALLTQIDKLYTRAEKCKVYLTANPRHTRAERDGLELEMYLIEYEIGEIAFSLGTPAFRKSNPRQWSEEKKRSLKALDDIQWNLNPDVYPEVLKENRLHEIAWQLTYLKELQRSLSTPYAESLPEKKRDEEAESIRNLDRMIKRLEALKI